MTRVFNFVKLETYSGPLDLPPDARSPFTFSSYIRFSERPAGRRFATVGRFNLVINFEHAAGRGPKKHRASLPGHGIIDSIG